MFSMLRSNMATLASSTIGTSAETVNVSVLLEKAAQLVQPFCQVSRAAVVLDAQPDCSVCTDGERCGLAAGICHVSPLGAMTLTQPASASR